MLEHLAKQTATELPVRILFFAQVSSVTVEALASHWLVVDGCGAGGRVNDLCSLGMQGEMNLLSLCATEQQ